VAHPLYIPRHDVAVALDVDEDDDGRFELAGVQDLANALLTLVFTLYELDALFNGIDGFSDVADGDDGGAAEVFACDALDGGRHGGCVHHGLAVAVFAAEMLGHHHRIFGVIGVGFLVVDGEGVEDLVDGFFEAEVDHAVGFVHDYVATLR